MVRIKCFPQEHVILTQPGLAPRPLYPESCTLTIRLQHLPINSISHQNKTTLPDKISWNTSPKSVNDGLLSGLPIQCC